MMPVLDSFVIGKIKQFLKYLAKKPEIIDKQFECEEKDKQIIKKLIEGYEIKVLSGYPREQRQIPCVVVVIDSENEVPYGLGSGIDEDYFDRDDNYLKWNEEETNYIQENTQMQINIRCEVWADSALVTSFLYSIVKYALLSTRFQMIDKGFINPSISGGDLEPATEYIPDYFIYRKAVILNLEYTISYYVQEFIAGKPNSQMMIGTDIDDIDIKLGGYSED